MAADAVTDAAIGLPELADNPVFASLRLARLYGRPQADRLTDFELARYHALAVEPQQVVLGQTESADGSFSTDTGMRSVPVVSV